jgi:DNA-binding response OmpR family regulator
MPQTQHILLVDDEPELTGITKEYLEAKGFDVTMCHNAEAGLEAFRKGKFHVCILDVKMPFKSGFSLAEDIRSLDAYVPIIFLTGQTDKEDRIKGLMLGADDYVTKPFSMQELFLRLKVVLRRMSGQQAASTGYTIGQYTFDPTGRSLAIGNRLARLSEMEAQLLLLFCSQPEGLVSRDLALSEIWQDESHVKSRSLNVYITKLRNRLKEDPHIEIINIHGTGYRLIVRGSSEIKAIPSE